MNASTQPPICPKCKKLMEPGRTEVEGYPYTPSYECWECLEVLTTGQTKKSRRTEDDR